ncbi:MAG: hypothetical protein K8S15_00225 [Candidatus Aegiribacteria sp.]|nr:hypothetical protein [Candidatus Aegiribacteria sp.]
MNPELRIRNCCWLSVILAVPFFLLGSILVVQSILLPDKLIQFFLNGNFIAGVLLVSVPLLVIVTLSVSLRKAHKMTSRLMNTGLIGVARFVSIYETTRMTGDEPIMRIELEITTNDHDPYSMLYIENANLIKPGVLYPGNRFRVMVDPNEKENILIDWTQQNLLNPDHGHEETSDLSKMITPSPDGTEVSECIPILST